MLLCGRKNTRVISEISVLRSQGVNHCKLRFYHKPKSSHQLFKRVLETKHARERQEVTAMSTTLTGSITTEPVSGSLSYYPTVTLSHSHTVIMSHCHTPTPTLSHPPPLPSLPGQLGVHDEGVEAPGGHPLALGAGGQRPGAGQVEHCLALLRKELIQ